MKPERFTFAVLTSMVVAILLMSSIPAWGSHVKLGDPIGAFLYCKTPESADKALTLLLDVKKGNIETFAPYRRYVSDPKVPCFDSRQIGIAQYVSFPIEKVKGYVRYTNDAVFTLWKVRLGDEIRYTWEGDEAAQA